ncbi:MAG: zinc-binding dehydrogenase, partial [Nitrospirota bacterium]
CRYCLAGKYTACGQLHAGNYDPGGFAEFIRIPEENVKHGTFLLPESMTYEEATMIEPLGCAIAGQRQLNLAKDRTVLIIGSGVSGLLHIQLAETAGAAVFATDLDEYRRETAKRFGADQVLDARTYSPQKLKMLNGGRLADCVIVCAAARQAVDAAIASVDRKGAILFFAVPRSDIVIPSTRFWRDEISVTFSYGAAPDDIQAAMRLVANKRIRVASLITHRLPLSNTQEAFRIASEGKNSLKVIVVPDEDI